MQNHFGVDNTAEQLTAHKDGLAVQLSTLYDQRKDLRNQTPSIKDDGKLTEVKAEIAALSAQITKLRREVRSCENIEKRSVEMKDKIHRAREAEKSKTKEVKQHEPFRGRR